MDRFTLSANTLSKTIKNIRADRIEIEIGDSKQLDFKPQFKIKRWDNEVNFSMRAQEEAGATMVEEDGKVKYKGKDIEVHQYEKTEAGEDGGFEFEWVLNKKPKSNVLRTTIQHKGLDFFYQPALTAEEIEQGASRDENVVGSYAVYHSTKRDNIVGGMEYQTGKAFHIYRPHAIDADGVKVWCELDIKDGELTVTVPEDFLNKASYPVVVDPTFGYTSVGGTNYNIAIQQSGFDGPDSSTRRGSPWTATEDGTITALDAYFVTIDGYTGANVKGAVNITNNPTTNSHEEVSQAEILNASISLPGWNTFILSGSIVNGTSYLLNVHSQIPTGVPNNLFVKGDTTGGGGYYSELNSAYTTLEDPWTSGALDTNDRLSIYATYTASSSYNPAFAHRRLLL